MAALFGIDSTISLAPKSTRPVAASLETVVPAGKPATAALPVVQVVAVKSTQPAKSEGEKQTPKKPPVDFDSCVQSLRSLVFEEMSHSKNLKTKDKARIGNFREQKLLALGGRSEASQKHGAKHLKQMRQAKHRKLAAQEQTVKHLQLVSETAVKFRASEADRRKKNKLKDKAQRKQAAKLLGNSR